MIKKLIISASLILVLVLYFTSFRCSKIVEPGAAFVAGTVTDSLSGLGIDSAWVDSDTIPPYDTYTDSTGYYVKFDGTPSINKFLYAGKVGYKTQKSQRYQTFEGNTTIVNFKLVPAPLK